METPIYLKQVSNGKIIQVMKITSKGSLEVWNNSISREEFNDTTDIKDYISWQKRECSMEDAKKQEYDNFDIETTKYINELKSL